MAGDIGRTRAVLGQPQAPQRHGGGEDRRLGLVGLVQLLFGAILGQRPEVITQRLGSLGERIKHQALLRADLTQHAERLRTLTGEDECGDYGHGKNP